MSDQQADDSRLAASHERAHEMDNGNAPGKLRVLVVEDSALHERSQSFLGEWCEVTVEASGT
ncbi:MAG: hypothetical protein AAFP90_16015 [Planctomycetota bacterium]